MTAFVHKATSMAIFNVQKIRIIRVETHVYMISTRPITAALYITIQWALDVNYTRGRRNPLVPHKQPPSSNEEYSASMKTTLGVGFVFAAANALADT